MSETIYEGMIEQIRETKPLIHQITNYVTVNDCANITLAIGASPIMADDIEEAADIASIASALVLNIGTLNSRTIESMLAAGKAANEKGIPVIFDPVGAGASAFRNRTTERILNEVKVDVLRGNISEIAFIGGISSTTKGVDASECDIQRDPIAIAKKAAIQYSCVAAVTGIVDVVSDGSRTVRIHNGHSAMSSITGTGCMCSALTGSFCGAGKEALFESTVSAVLSMGIAGEIAYEHTKQYGNGSFHMGIMDVISKLNSDILSRRAKLYEA